MSATIPDEYRDLVGPPVIPVLGTLNADGTVQVTPVWATYDGEHILVGSARGRLKDRNMRARRAVTLTFVDPANPYRYVSVSGEITDVLDEDDPTRGGAVTEHIDDTSESYVNQRPYPFRSPAEVRTLFRVRPARVHGYGAQ